MNRCGASTAASGRRRSRAIRLGNSPSRTMMHMETTVTEMLESQLRYLAALHEIVSDSSDPDAVRVALSALTSTDNGIEYLRANPIVI